MSNVFKRVISIETEERPSFYLGSEVYEALISDSNMPVSQDGTLPIVVFVDYGRLARLLVAAGLLSDNDLSAEFCGDECLKRQIEHHANNYISPSAIEELRDDQDMIEMLIKDFCAATKERSTMIWYYVG